MAELSAHWGFDMTPMDDWPMTVEADGMEIKSLTISVEFEDGNTADMRFVPDEEILQLHEETERLRSCLSDDAEFATLIMGENKELRRLCRDLRFCAGQSVCIRCPHGRFCDMRFDERCKELGVDTKDES